VIDREDDEKKEWEIIERPRNAIDKVNVPACLRGQLHRGNVDYKQRHADQFPSRFARDWRDRFRWWCLFLTFNEPEQIHRGLVLENLDSTGADQFGGLVKFTLIEASAVFIFPMIFMGLCISLAYRFAPMLILPSVPLAIVGGMFIWLEGLHIAKDLPTEPIERKFTTRAIWNAALRLWICPRCLFPLNSNGGVCKVCGAEILPKADQCN
jgi:hypothetical protein